MSTIYASHLIMYRQRISQHFYLALLEFLMSAKQHLMSIGNELGLSSIQAVTLLLLDEHQPRPMKSFCALFHCDASNITGIMDGLEKKGLVSRQNDLHDRRIKVIQLESAGKQLQQVILTKLDADRGFLFDPLTDAEQQQLITIIEKLAPTSLTTQTKL
jgi:DNA-binding MarR family transcriptional regulator